MKEKLKDKYVLRTQTASTVIEAREKMMPKHKHGLTKVTMKKKGGVLEWVLYL